LDAAYLIAPGAGARRNDANNTIAMPWMTPKVKNVD
jgi:hypothetical protein